MGRPLAEHAAEIDNRLKEAGAMPSGNRQQSGDGQGQRLIGVLANHTGENVRAMVVTLPGSATTCAVRSQ